MNNSRARMLKRLTGVIYEIAFSEASRIQMSFTRQIKIIYAKNNENLRGAGDRDRTGMASLEGWGSTIELHPQMKIRCVNKLHHA